MPLKIMCWNIENFNLSKADEYHGDILPVISRSHINIILENKTKAAEILGFFLGLLKQYQGNWNALILDAGGGQSNSEYILVIYNTSLTVAPFDEDSKWVENFNKYPFEAKYENKTVYSNYRIPVAIQVTDQNKKKISIAAIHCPGPNQNGMPHIVKVCAMKILTSIGIDLFLGDFNCYDKYGCLESPYRFDSSLRPTLHWYGDSEQGTTFVKRQGERISEFTDSPLDRVYINTTLRKKTSVAYLTDNGLYVLTDHIPVIATVNDIGPTDRRLLEEKLPLNVLSDRSLTMEFKITQPMSLIKLAALLQQQVDEKKKFNLNDSTLGIQGFNTWMKSTPLNVSSIELNYSDKIPSPQQDKLIISGAVTDLLNQSKLIASVTFIAINNQVSSFMLEAKSSSSLMLNGLFPQLPKTGLNSLIFTNPAITFGTNLISPAGSAGLRFSGQMPLGNKGFCGLVRSLWKLGEDAKSTPYIPMKGPVAYDGQNNLTIDLQSDDLKGSATLPVLNNPLTGRLRAVYNNSLPQDFNDKNILPNSGFYLLGKLSLSETNKVSMTMSEFEKETYLLGFGDVSQPLADFDDLNSLCGQSRAWQDLLKPINKLFKNLTLQYTAIILQVKPSIAIPWLELQVNNTTPYDLFEIGSKTISLDIISLRLLAASPFSSKDNYRLTLSSIINLGNGWDFEVSMTNIPELHISGGLTMKKNNSLTLKQVISRLTNQQFNSIPDEVAELKLDNIVLDIAILDITRKAYICTFDIGGSISLLDISFENIIFRLVYESATKKFGISLAGQLQIASVLFNVSADLNKQGSTLTLSWKGQEDKELSLNVLFQEIGAPLTLPQELDFLLQEAIFTYTFGVGKRLILEAKLVVDGQTINAAFIVLPTNSIKATKKIVSIAINMPAKLARLPMVGQIPSPVNRLQFFHSTQDLDEKEISVFNQYLTDSSLQLPVLTQGEAFPTGSHFCLTLADSNNPIFIPLGDNSESKVSSRLTTKDSSSSAAVWVKLGKTLGPLTLRRIGFNYRKARLWLMLDSSLSIGPLTAGLMGLGVGIPLNSISQIDQWDFELDGLNLSYATGPLLLSGSFMREIRGLPSIVQERYSGETLIKIENLIIGAFGSYAKFTAKYEAETGQSSSVFVFARVNYPFGGPPFFYITGLAGGFGYNQNLMIPTPDQVVNFPLVQGSVDPDALGGKDADLITVEQKLLGDEKTDPAWIIPQAGSIWLALGINFTTFELLGTRALAVLEMGQEFQLAILGRSLLNLPKSGTSIINVEMGLEAVFNPDKGVFGMTAILSPNSYVLSKDCHLTGGFAFYSWLKDQVRGASAGDFVTTLGGYHPSFPAPTWYPKVPRLGFSWHYGDHITIDGEAYAALTSSAVMMGGLLQALFQAGGLKAWFKTGADFLIEWHPFHYEGDIDISVGASYRLNLLFTTVTLGFEIGAAMAIWGPPTGGRIKVDLWVISFTIPFGEDQDPQPKMKWEQFRQFLPSSQKQNQARIMGEFKSRETDDARMINRVSAEKGLLKQITASDQSIHWMVRGDKFCFRTETAIPAVQITLNNKIISHKGQERFPTPLFIKPMGVDLSHTHQVLIEETDVKGVGGWSPVRIEDGWQSSVITGNLPDALWGRPLVSDPSSSLLDRNLLNDCWVGLKVQSPEAQAGVKLNPVDVKSTFKEEILYGKITRKNGCLPLKTSSPAQPQPLFNPQSIEVIADEKSGISVVEPQRNKMIDNLKKLGIFKSSIPLSNMTVMAGKAGEIFLAPPLMAPHP